MTVQPTGRTPDQGAHEAERLTAVRRLRQLDTPPHERFDRITRLACARFRTPIAEINLVDEYRQFTKSPQVEGQSPSSPRNESFCDITIQQPGVMVVEDATMDDRFSAKTTVTGERHIRFYAGVPLRVGGHAVGTLCLVDTTPRDFSDSDRTLLERMGAWAEAILADNAELRRAREVQESLLPAGPIDGDVEAAGLSFPSANLSGDLYDWHASDGRFVFTLVNVFEEGTAAAITAASIRSAFQAHRGARPVDLVRDVDDQLGPDLRAAGATAAVFHGWLDTDTGELDYVDAGLGLSAIVRFTGEIVPLPVTGRPLGFTAHSRWTRGSARLGPGDCLVTCTGGLAELLGATDAPAAGIASLIPRGSTAQKAIERVRDVVAAAPENTHVTAVAVSRRRF